MYIAKDLKYPFYFFCLFPIGDTAEYVHFVKFVQKIHHFLKFTPTSFISSKEIILTILKKKNYEFFTSPHKVAIL